MLVWNRDTGQVTRRFECAKGEVTAVAFSPDGRCALSGGSDRIVRHWDLEAGNTISALRGHSDRVTSVAFSPDGGRAYSASGGRHFDKAWRPGTDPAIRVWDLQTGGLIRKLEGLTGCVWSLAVSPDGRSVLGGGDDGDAVLWDATTGAEIRRFPGAEILRASGVPKAVRCVAFLPDGRRAVTGGDDRTLRLWDVKTGQELWSFRGHTGGVVGVAVSPDGRRMLSSAWDSPELRLWDVETGRCLQQINWGVVRPTRGTFTRDGRELVWPGFEDGTIRIYRLAPYDAKPSPGTDASARPF